MTTSYSGSAQNNGHAPTKPRAGRTAFDLNQGKDRMLTEIQLKEKLQSLADKEFRVPEADALSEILPAMLHHIGSVDSSLREDLIYSAFGTWILDYKVVGPEPLRTMLPVILDEQHMLYNIGEQNTDSVFRRSFSALLLPLILITHRSQPFLGASEIHQIKETLLYYLAKEKDCRGFVQEKGWAHAMAHAADALDDLAQCSELNGPELMEILDAIHNVICRKDAVYAAGEEERIVTAVIAIIDRELLSENEIIQWIDGFAIPVLSTESILEGIVIRSNVKNFLQSLYFRIQWERGPNSLDAPISRLLQRINPFTRSQGG